MNRCSLLTSVCRLLAMEVYDTCNADGLYCNLITGALQHVLCLCKVVLLRAAVIHITCCRLVAAACLPACVRVRGGAGQERREVPGALHTACTVEMVSMQRRVDVAVLDEIQMIGDDSRWVGR